jgi:hypothetical protein
LRSKGDPKVLETRKKRVASLDDTIRRMQVQNAGRRPNWSEERILVYDRIALESGKRCVLWDDTGNGFFLVSHLLKKFAFLEYKVQRKDRQFADFIHVTINQVTIFYSRSY